MLKKKAILLLMIMSLGLTSVSCSKSNDIDKEETTKIDVSEPSENDIEKSTCRLFYFDAEKLALNYIEKELEIEEDKLSEVLVEELKSKYADSFLTLSSNATVDKIEKDDANDLVNVYFDKDFVSEMTLGTSTESGLISSIVNTFGYNFGVSKVGLYMDGELYTGLKGDVDPGYFNVDYENCVEYSTEASSEDIYLVYYDGASDSLVKSKETFKITANSKAEDIAKLLTEVDNENYISFKDILEVESISEDVAGGILYVNLTEKYYEILKNVGSGSELGALESISYTFGINYGFDKVIINVGGEPYCGSHIEFSPEEFITVDMNKVK